MTTEPQIPRALETEAGADVRSRRNSDKTIDREADLALLLQGILSPGS